MLQLHLYGFVYYKNQHSLFISLINKHGQFYQRKSIVVAVHLVHLYIYKLHTLKEITFLKKRRGLLFKMCILIYYAILSFNISNFDLFFAANNCLIKIKFNTLLCDMAL